MIGVLHFKVSDQQIDGVAYAKKYYTVTTLRTLFLSENLIDRVCLGNS